MLSNLELSKDANLVDSPTKLGTARLVQRATQFLKPDSSRVLAMLYLPGQEIVDDGVARVNSVIERVLGMTDEEVATTLGETIGRYADRHLDLGVTLAENYSRVAHRLPKDIELTTQRRELLGAYFTKEYSVEGAALFNPSAVPHPDQTGLEESELRFILTLRAVGEGHISTIEFRTGVLAKSEVHLEEPGRYLLTGRASQTAMSREFLRESLAERGEVDAADEVLSLLPDTFDADYLSAAIATVEIDELTGDSVRQVAKEIRWIASCNYRVDFPGDRPLSERVLYPNSPDESHGMEDARFTQFVDEEGSMSYMGTYTAYDGARRGGLT